MNALKKTLKVILKVIIILVLVVAISGLGVFGAVKYLRWKADQNETISTDEKGNVVITPNKKELEPNVTCLFMGINGALTDFIMLGQYNPNTREISLLSIPRDTKVEGTIDGKINSAYAGKYPERSIARVKDVTGIEAQYYVIFKTKVLRQIVDEIGGVTVDVPINMNYDDPVQNLYIHLKKGTQTLTGSQAEQFVRFRKSNDGSGYVNGDVDRVKAQQQFIKATISRVLEPQNLIKVNKLVKIVTENTKTNITWDIAKDYIDDVATFKMDRITMDTIPGHGGYAENGLSYYFYDKEKTKELVDSMFNKKAEENQEEENIEVIGNVSEEESKNQEGKIKIEVLNAGTTSSIFTAVVEKLNDAGYYVSKVGNYSSESTEYSRVITYGTDTEKLGDIKTLLGISKEETADTRKMVDYTVILGPKYELD